MTKLRVLHRCRACGATQPRWAGRCPTCGEWGSLHEELEPAGEATPGRGSALLARVAGAGGTGWGAAGWAGARGGLPVALAEVDPDGHRPMPTGLAEVDRVLSGGLLPGSATLLGGEPGTGKSTLLLQVLASMASSGRRCLLVAAEEAAHQVRRRAARLGADVPGLLVAEATELAAVEAAIANASPEVVVVDSVQAINDSEVGSAAGSPAQVRGCAHRLVTLAKATGAALVLVGHVTKDGALAGPRALEHLVDTVLSFEGDRYSSLRALRSLKHRFGPTGETGLFEMGERGLVGVTDPSSLFLGDRVDGLPGSAVTVPVEGHRPFLVEVQALVGRPSGFPRRFVTGLDAARVGFLVAVLERWAGVELGDREVYVSVAGGAKAYEPATDLAICVALTSCLWRAPARPGLVVLGEVGLGGEVRRVSATPRRLAEARRLGFTDAVVPAALEPPLGPEARTSRPPSGAMELHPAATLSRALALALGGAPPGHPSPTKRRPHLSAEPGPVRPVGALRPVPPVAVGAGGARDLVAGTGRADHRLASASAGQVERGDGRGTGPDSPGPVVA